MPTYQVSISRNYPYGMARNEAEPFPTIDLANAYIECQLDMLFPGQWEHANEAQYWYKGDITNMNNIALAVVSTNYTLEERERAEMERILKEIDKLNRRLIELKTKYATDEARP